MDNIIFNILAGVIAILFGYGMYAHFTLPANTASNAQIKKRQENYADSSHICSACGHELTNLTVFCPNCHTITPRIRETLNASPNKNPMDYLGQSDDNGDICPLCRQDKIHVRKPFSRSPILCCPNCYGYFISPSISEPFLTETPSLLQIIASQFMVSVFICITAWSYFEVSIPVLILLLCITTFVLSVWAVLTRKLRTKTSVLRFKRNPDYPQILADMGYLHNLSPEIRSNLKKYGPNGEVRCTYCNELSITEDSHCPHCTAPLPTQRYRSTTTPTQSVTSHNQHSKAFVKKVAFVIMLAFVTALIIWILL